MRRKNKSGIGLMLERFSLKATKATGTSGAFVIALVVLIVWGISGPLFNFSDTWQLVINTGTTIVTFLMVFLIQRTRFVRRYFGYPVRPFAKVSSAWLNRRWQDSCSFPGSCEWPPFRR